MSLSTFKKSTLTIPNDISYLPIAISFVNQNASIRGFNQEAINDIELAVEEAVSNVLQHAFSEEEEAEFSITSEQLPLGLKIIIKDKGMPFDPGIIPIYDPNSQQKEIAPKGLGWHLMRQFMDEVTFNNLGQEGKELWLTKFLPEETIEKQETQKNRKSELPGHSEPAFPKNSIAFSVRRSQKKDAIEIAKCAYDAYAYSYIYEHVYFPDRLGALLESGQIISAIAVTKGKEEEIMAHNALMIEDPKEKLAEMGMTFTKQTYQNQGCSRKIGILLIKEAIKGGIAGIYAATITTHIFSQRATVNAGSKDCAILLGKFPANFEWKHFENQGQRVSAVLTYFKVPLTSMLRTGRRKGIYLPKQHEEIIKKIYKTLGQKRHFVELKPEDLTALPEKTTVRIDLIKTEKKVKIKIDALGKDSVSYVESTVKRLCIEKVEVFNLYIRLTDPFVPMFTKEFEDLGFFFAGILPGPVKGDQLIFQYLNNILMDYDKIQLYTDFAKELLAYIKKRDPIFNAIERT